MRVARFFLLFLLVATVIAIMARRPLGELILAKILTAGGAGEVALHIAEMDWRHCKVDRLSCRIGSQVDGTEIKLRDLTVHYQPAGLICGRIQEVVLGALEISLPPGEKATGKAVRAGELCRLPHQDRRDQVPFQSLAVQALTIHGASGFVLNPVTTKLFISADQPVISVEAIFSRADKAPLYLLAVSPDAAHLSLSLASEKDAEPPGLQVDLHDDQTGGQGIEGKFTLEPDWLAVMAAFIDQVVPTFKGTVTGAFALPGCVGAEGAGAGNGRVTGQARWMPPGLGGELQLDVDHDPEKARGRAVLRTITPLDFSAKNVPLGEYLTGRPLPLDFDLTRGKLRFAAEAGWSTDAPFNLNLQLDLADGAGETRSFTFDGLAMTQDLEVFPRLRSREPGTVAINTLKGAIEAHSLSAVTSLEPSDQGRHPRLRLNNIAARFFGGGMAIDDLAYDFNRPASSCVVRLQGIDPAEIFSVYPVRGLEVSGLVEGTIPVSFTPDGVTVKDGMLRNAGSGGIIRYLPPEKSGLEQSGLTAYALKVLEEFKYDLLQAAIHYSPDGTLELNFKLQGKNEQLDPDRPVHLNVNTEQNLLSLLRSFEYSNRLEKEMDTRARQRAAGK